MNRRPGVYARPPVFVLAARPPTAMIRLPGGGGSPLHAPSATPRRLRQLAHVPRSPRAPRERGPGPGGELRPFLARDDPALRLPVLRRRGVAGDLPGDPPAGRPARLQPRHLRPRGAGEP